MAFHLVVRSTDHEENSDDGAADISQLAEIDGVLYAYDQVANLGSDYHGDLYAFDAASGELKWHYLDTNGKHPSKPEYNKHGPMIYNLVQWQGGLLPVPGSLI